MKSSQKIKKLFVCLPSSLDLLDDLLQEQEFHGNILSSLSQYIHAQLSSEVECDTLELALSNKGSQHLSRRQWKRGKDYLNNSEGSWSWLIGSNRYEKGTYTTYEKYCDYDRFGGRQARKGYDECNYWYFKRVTRTYTRLVKEESDGFIPKGSQTGAKASNWNPRIIEARGVNHSEMGTHKRTREILKETWNGRYGDNFKIPI